MVNLGPLWRREGSLKRGQCFGTTTIILQSFSCKCAHVTRKRHALVGCKCNVWQPNFYSFLHSIRACFSVICVHVDDNKQLLEEVFAISGIIKVEVLSAEPDNTYQDLDYFGYHKNSLVIIH